MKVDEQSSTTRPSSSGRYELYPVDVVYHNDRRSGQYCVYIFAKQVGVGLDSHDRRRLVVVEVTGWMPYMFLKVKDDNVHEMERTISERLQEARRSCSARPNINYVHEIIDTSSDLKFIDGYGYHPDDAKERFIKVSVSDPSVYRKFAEIVPYEVYMAQLDHVCQFKIDVGLAHPNKLLSLVPGIAYYEGPNESLRLRTSVQNLEVIDNDCKETPTLKAMSIDIKCISESGGFPNADNGGDRIIQIASVTTSDVLRAKHDSGQFEKCVFVVGSCDSVKDADVRCYETEFSMLYAFMNHVVSTDPDIITGYKVRNFDWPYILDRFRILKMRPSFSRRRNGWNWSHYSRNDRECLSCPDRILIDICTVIKTERKLRSDSLDSIVAEFLPDEAPLDDLKYGEIKELHEATPATRAKIARCCATHAFIPIKLMIKFNTAMSMLELSNITGVPMRYIYDRGQQVRVMTLIAREAYARKMLFPTNCKRVTEQRDSHNNNSEGSSTDSGGDEAEAKAKKPAYSGKRKAESSDPSDVGYQGAKVVEPKIGYYDDPVCTLDFASLYPSIIIAMNLCYSTLRLQHSKRQKVDAGNEEKEEDDDDDCYKYAQSKPSPVGDEFEPESVRKRILPTVLEGLLESRKQVKEEMEKCKDDPFMRSVLNERQLAIKKSSNSVYGFTGTKENGMLPCVQIARSVTAYGRTLMDKTIHYVEKFTQHNVIYGDTDSVMILCRRQSLDGQSLDGQSLSVAEAMDMGKKLADLISLHFPHPIRLEFEKVYKPYLLVGKKKYAGAMYSSNPDSRDKVDIKGLDTVRKNCTPYVSQITKDCLRDLIEKGDIEAALKRATEAVDNLLSGRVVTAELILYKTYAKDYKNAAPHLCVVEKRIARGGKPAKVGDRIPYVICKELVTDRAELQKEYQARPRKFINCESKVTKRYSRKVAYRAEDPDYVKDEHLPIDCAYYVNKQLKRPLLTLFGTVLGGKHEAARKIWPTKDWTRKREESILFYFPAQKK